MEGASKLSPTAIRLPTELRLWLKHQAVDNMRSLNDEIVFRLQQSRQKEDENLHDRDRSK